MKPIDILDALSDLPEEYAAFAVQKSASETPKRGIIMETKAKRHQQPESRQSRAFHISKIGAAAAVVLCLGLNAALIFGLAQMRRDSGTFTPAATAPEIEEIRTAAVQSGTVTVPDMVGMDWETAKQTAEALGLHLAKQPVDPPNGEPPGTVVEHCGAAGDELEAGSVILCNVVTNPAAPDSEIVFEWEKDYAGWYYIYVRNAQQEILGYSISFPGENDFQGICVERTEKNAAVEAVLVNMETKQEAVIGSYILHQSPEAYSEEWHTFVKYDTVTEDIEGAFEQLQTPYSVNENGQTYGTTRDTLFLENQPDLIAVIGDNGKQGYIYSRELFGDIPSSPEEAVKIQESIENGTYLPKTLNVYESDGVTVIDTFTESLT